MTLTYALGNIAPGAVLSIGANTFRVLAVNTGAKTATVIPGHNGSTDANASIGALVRVNPRFTDSRIIKAINDQLNTLSAPSAGLYAIATPQTLTIVGSAQGYEITPATGFLRVLEVRRLVTDDATGYVRVPGADWELLRTAPTTFTSGIALRFLGTAQYMTSAQVVWAKTFTAITDVTANVTTTGIPTTAEDIPPLGAALRIMAGREVPRNAATSQAESRKANEVPPGAVGASYRGLQGLWAQRVKEEADRLRTMYPVGK